MGTTFRSKRAGLARAATAVALAAGIASMVAVQGAGASSVEQHAMRTHDAHAASTSGGNLVDNTGQILASSHSYIIWWGSASGWSSFVRPGIAQLLSGFNGSNYLGIAQQYMRGASISSALSATFTDTSPPPSKVSASTLGNEVTKVLTQYGVKTVDKNGIYFVYTSNFPRGGNFCAWHSYATVSGQKISVAYMPNTTGIAGCNPGTGYTGSTTDEGLASLANVTAHEFMESVTDTFPASGTYGWIDNSGSEIGDKCAWQFSGPVSLTGGSVWKLQEEWSNAVSGCVQGS